MPDPFVVDMCGLWFDNLNRGCLPSIHLFHTWTLEVTAPASATSSVGYCIHMYPPRWPELNFYKKRRARKHWSQDSLSWILMTYIKTVETCMKSLNTWLVTYGTNMDKHDKRLEVILNTTASCDQEAESRNPSPISLAAGKHNRGDSDTENATDWKWLNHIEPITETYIETVYVCELLEKLLESTNDIKRPEDFLRVTGQNHLRACTTVQQHNKAMVLGNGATEFLLICHCVNRRQSVQVIVDCLKPPYAFIGYLTTCYVPRALCLRPTAMPGERAGEHVKKLRNPNTGRHWIGIWWKIRTVECKFRLIDQEKGEEMEKDILGSTCKEKNGHWLLECFHFLPFKSLLKETTTLGENFGEICSVSSIVKQFLKLVSQYTISCVPTCCKQNQKIPHQQPLPVCQVPEVPGVKHPSAKLHVFVILWVHICSYRCW